MACLCTINTFVCSPQLSTQYTLHACLTASRSNKTVRVGAYHGVSMYNQYLRLHSAAVTISTAALTVTASRSNKNVRVGAYHGVSMYNQYLRLLLRSAAHTIPSINPVKQSVLEALTKVRDAAVTDKPLIKCAVDRYLSSFTTICHIYTTRLAFSKQNVRGSRN
ncbi:hypothetical protein J6590_006937 [Homalodisca vitripennis]|nr:hypothetical protein J6590_006937 [Homalodisca vitripennis]